MEATLGSMFSNRRHSSGNKSRKRNLSDKSSPLLKPPQLFNSVKGLMHIKTRSVGNMRGKKAIAKYTHANFASRSQRSQSLDLPQEPPSFQKRGSTPGMDDYLTLAQLENVWHTQGYMLGSPDVPQTASEYTYTYTEPVELGTFVKHQRDEDLVSPITQADNQLRVRGVLPRSQEPAGSANESHDSGICPPFAIHRDLPTPCIRTSSPDRTRGPVITTQKPQAVHDSKRLLKPSSRPPSRSRTRSPAPRSMNENGDRQAMLDPLTIPNARRPSTAPSQDAPSSPVVSPESPERRPARGRNTSRNEVVSGIVHPALRPAPYFSPRQQSAPGCRVATSRFAVDVPRNTALMQTKV